MSNSEIVEYYYTNIEPYHGWFESNDGRFYFATNKIEGCDYVEHSSSTIQFMMKPRVEQHIKEKPIREALKDIIENG